MWRWLISLGGRNATFRFVPSDKSDGNKERSSELGFVGLKDYRIRGMVEYWNVGKENIAYLKARCFFFWGFSINILYLKAQMNVSHFDR